jgi:hypothetical protein
MASLPERLQEQSGAWLRAQSAFIDATQTMMSAWRKCRQDDMEATLTTIQKVMGSKNGADVAAAYSEWLTDSMERVKAEFSDAREEALRLTGTGENELKGLSARVGTMHSARTNFTGSKTPSHHVQEAPVMKSNPEPRKHAAAE